MPNSPADFDHSAWGRQRLVFLQLGYIFLTMKSAQLDEATRSLIENMDLSSRIGPISIRMASADERPGLMLAERLYTYVMSQDEKAFEVASSLGDAKQHLFKDPLVYSRYASSLFLQERFGQAKTVLDQILFTDDFKQTLNRRIFDQFDVSIHEMLMRHSQYIFLRHFSEDEKLIDNIKGLIKDFEPILSDMSTFFDNFDQKHFRAVCWYFLCSQYIATLNIITPSFVVLHKESVENYLKTHITSGATQSFDLKPEILCAKHLLTTRESGQQSASFDHLSRQLQADSNYPPVFSACYLGMIERVEHHRRSESADKPKVFFSYSHRDRKLAERIVNYLIDTGIDILSDKQFVAGDSLMSGMQRAIQNAEACILFVSRNYLESTGWLEKERETIFARNVAGETAIVVLTFGVSVAEIQASQPMLANNLLIALSDERLDIDLYKVSNHIQASIAKLRDAKLTQIRGNPQRGGRRKK